eukprot:6185346-Pleurochrysis_carterae.AAC.2
MLQPLLGYSEYQVVLKGLASSQGAWMHERGLPVVECKRAFPVHARECIRQPSTQPLIASYPHAFGCACPFFLYTPGARVLLLLLLRLQPMSTPSSPSLDLQRWSGRVLMGLERRTWRRCATWPDVT